MPSKTYKFESQAIESVILGWINTLPAEVMDRFFWDYPAATDRGSTGYGLGLTVARRIVSRRNALPHGFRDLQSLLNVKGFGRDKLEDMKMQAQEALALAAYYELPSHPALLADALTRLGPGRSLPDFIRKLESYTTTAPHLCRANEMTLRIPFIAVTMHQKQSSQDLMKPEQFLRIRTQPWAFSVHPPNLWWKLILVLSGNDSSLRLERVD